ncbi:M23 family metallopeptidase [Georgenia yuyongxinii]|uniref:M23 family metallopeptidase n=1 Tax=Georgenia yuyongxinii TaxID=2589797 RepID=A0A5B8C018_9MICO|nr:M23 family metallopeptidase [Georgenia yuyongxinii]QDC23873.1 M23 family metallopeptidase [Georgenia yuyongxinii]
MTRPVAPHPVTGKEALPPPTRRRRNRRRLILVVLAVVAWGAAVLVLGPFGLIPFGLLLAFSIDPGEEETGPSVRLTTRNLGLAVAMLAAFAWFWLGYPDLPKSTLVVIAGVLIALPLGLQASAGNAARDRTIVVTKRSLILALWGLVLFAVLYQEGGVWLYGLAVVCVVVPLSLAVSRVWVARRGRIELGLLRHPLRRDMRGHLVQGLNIWLCCALLGGLLAAGGAHIARVPFSLSAAQLDLVVATFAAGLVLLAALALVPRRRVHAATNVVVALLSGFLVLQLGPASTTSADAVVLDSPLAGEWFVFNGGRSVLLNGHSGNERHAIDFARLGANGRTHPRGGAARLTDYTGFGSPVLAPVDGLVVGVADGYPDNPPGTNGDRANHVVVAIGRERYVLMAHLQQGSVSVRVGDVVRRGQLVAAVGNNGHSSEPHLHLQVQDSAAGIDAERTYPMVFRDVDITRGGAWPWGDSRELRTGDLVRGLG